MTRTQHFRTPISKRRNFSESYGKENRSLAEIKQRKKKSYNPKASTTAYTYIPHTSCAIVSCLGGQSCVLCASGIKSVTKVVTMQ